MVKNIVVFMDGTRNKPSDARTNEHSNIYRTYRAYKHGAGQTTVPVYVRGVGTVRDEAVNAATDSARKARRLFWQRPARKLIRRIGRYISTRPEWLVQHYGAAAIGWGVADRIEEGYRHIATHYRAGDRVYIFGFSRGAYEARSLAGFVDKVGLRLHNQATGPDRRNLIGQAYALFRGGDREAFDHLETFLRRRARVGALAPEKQVAIHMVGVYDTVGALGAVGERPLDNRSLARLLERWLPGFTPRFARRLLERLMTTQSARPLPPNTRYGCHAIAAHELRETFEVLLWDPPQDEVPQTVRQVLFAGAHADVGGGYAKRRLSNHAQAWMVEESDRLAALAGVPLPKGPPAGPLPDELMPHHEVTGLFAMTGPKKRILLSGPEELEIATLCTLEIHASALNRLFDNEVPILYEDYAFDGTFPWDRRYPKKVAGAFTEIDGLLVRLQLRLQRPSFTPTLDKLRRQPPGWDDADWHDLADLGATEVMEKVRQSLSDVNRWNPRDRSCPVPDKKLLQSIATLLACKQQAYCLDLVGRLGGAPPKHLDAMRHLKAEFHALTRTVRRADELRGFLNALDKALV